MWPCSILPSSVSVPQFLVQPSAPTSAVSHIPIEVVSIVADFVVCAANGIAILHRWVPESHWLRALRVAVWVRVDPEARAS